MEGSRFVLLLVLLLFSELFCSASAAQDEQTLDYQEGGANLPLSSGKRLDYGRLFYFGAGIHKFENDHLHPGKQAVLNQDESLVRTLLNKGVEADHFVELIDEAATSKACKSRLSDLLACTKPGDTLLFFLHSHGSLNRGGLVCTYETGGIWTFEELINQIEKEFKGSQVCICVAACHSGSLLEVIRSQPRSQAYYAVTSVHPDQSALTVATADFEACIRDCFRGASCPDLNRDGVITFAEMGRYVCNDQSILFGTTPDFGASDKFDESMVITNAETRQGNLQCRLVELRNGTKGRVVRQEGERLLVRGSKNPSLLESCSRNGVRILRPRF